MTQLGRLSAEVVFVEGIAIYLNRYALDYRHAKAFKGIHLAWIIRHEPQRRNAEVIQHGLAQVVSSHVCRKTQLFVGLDGVGAGILQLIGTYLVYQADAASFLPHIQQSAAPFGSDGPECGFKLSTAITTLAEQSIARQAFRVYASHYRLAIVDVAQGKHDMLFTGGGFDEHMDAERGPWSRQFA